MFLSVEGFRPLCRLLVSFRKFMKEKSLSFSTDRIWWYISWSRQIFRSTYHRREIARKVFKKHCWTWEFSYKKENMTSKRRLIESLWNFHDIITFDALWNHAKMKLEFLIWKIFNMACMCEVIKSCLFCESPSAVKKSRAAKGIRWYLQF